MITYTHQSDFGETSGGGLASSTVIFSLPPHSQQVIESSNALTGVTFLVSLPALIPADLY